MQTNRDIYFNEGALGVLYALEAAGFEAWFVGGCVRDALRGVAPHDFDMATNALWQETKAACEAAGFAVHETGTAHGTVTVVAHGTPVEVTTYRREGAYSDARHPDAVSFVGTVEEDLARRDFTMNAIAYHPGRGLTDPFGGEGAIAAGRIEAVGNAHERFAEDPLRIMRGVRFASQLGFCLEPQTFAAMCACAPQLESVARERIGHEMRGLLQGEHAARALVFCAPVVIWAFGGASGLDEETVVRAAGAVGLLPARADVRLAALLRAAERHGEAPHPARIEAPCDCARALAARLRLDRATRARVLQLCALRDCRLEPTHAACAALAAYLGGNVHLAQDACALQLAEARLGGGGAAEASARVCARQMQSLAAEGAPLALACLKATGADVMEWLQVRGALVGYFLKCLLVDVLEGRIPNERAALAGACAKHAALLAGAGGVGDALGAAADMRGRTANRAPNHDPIKKCLEKHLTQTPEARNIPTRACEAHL